MRYEIQVKHDFTDLLHLLLHEEAYLNNHSSLEPEILDLKQVFIRASA